jgi:hypothetical protein
MKKHQLILGTTAIFSFLFYNESLGINLALFTLALLIITVKESRNKTTLSKLFIAATLLSVAAFAYYGDIASFFALSLSLIFLQFQSQDPQLKLIQTLPIVILNMITSIGRPLIFSQWFPKTKIDNNGAKKIIAYFLIPSIFLVLFFIAYSFGSETFSSLFQYELDLDFWHFLVISCLGFFISFSFWNYFTPNYCHTINSKLDNEFSAEAIELSNNSFSFLDLDFERKSGEISLVLLNFMLVVFIGTYNYEQFFKVPDITNLSAATHDRVNAVIISIIMAVAVILFYFKGGFNFDAKAKILKRLAKIWICLNGILIISSAIKNSEYILEFGMTYKRLGVYAFLTITFIGLVITFLKIKNKKTNAFLFNQMFMYLYGLVLVCAVFNWGNLITTYNISVNKGVDPQFISRLNFNDEARRAYFKDNQLDGDYNEESKEREIRRNQNTSFLSKKLYYLSIEKIKQ